MRGLLETIGFRGLRGRSGNRPAAMPFGRFPIDRVPVRGGVRVMAIPPFGGELASKHLRFVVEFCAASPPPAP